MKFNKIYLHGFKSFVEKTVVDFPDGITAIVGPNGSGKSNIMDAVRWVFGEQNAKELRGSEMEDIVFNGSAKRKAAGFAEVALTLSDIDEAVASKYGTFSEITISRKFYKTGEREYYINNRKCRLKDIKEIFMDTGLGARSISIIEQGKVDKIINATPEELRFFLEETAGVTRFKDKKKEAERRLDQTRENLDRVNDIITEILSRMESLSAQVAVLKESEELQSQKREFEKRYFSSSYATKVNEISVINAGLIEKKRELTAKIAEYNDLVRRENVANSEQAGRQNELKSLQDKRLELTTNVTKAQGRIDALKNQLANAENTKSELAGDIEKQESKLKELVSSKERLSEDIESAGDALREVDDKIDDLNDIIDDIKSKKEEIDDEFATSDSLFLELTSEITSKRNKLIRAESDMEHSNSALAKLVNEVKEADNFSKDKMILKEELVVKIDSLSTKLMVSEAALSEIADEYAKLKSESDSSKIALSELSAGIKAAKKSVEFLEGQLKINTAINDSDIIKRFHPSLLLDTIKLEDAHAKVDIADIMLFKDSDKSDLLSALDETKSSLRFTFEGDIGKVEEHISQIIAIEGSAAVYSVSGIYKKVGDDDKSAKIIKIIESLKEESAKLSELEDGFSSLEVGIAQQDEHLNAKYSQKSTAEKSVSEAKTGFTKSGAELESINAEIERSQKRSKTIGKEVAIAQSALDEVGERVKSLRQAVDETAEKLIASEDERAAFEDKLEFIEAQLEDKKDEMRELKIARSIESEKVSSLSKEAASIDSRLADAESSITSLKSRLDKLINIDEESWRASLKSLQAEHNESTIGLLSNEESIKRVDNLLIELRSDIEELKNNTDICNSSIRAAEEAIKQAEILIASASSFIDSISTQFFEKFNEQISAQYLLYADESFQPKKIKDEIAKLEEKLESLGAINLSAVNDYKEIEDRYNFLSKQRTDLEGSIADINAFIYDTDGTTVKMFEETFNSVKGKFIEVFHILFGNGEAELKLTEPDNMLTTGVEIYIQPPGKRLQHMGLLSGGEKALTAMTLLFALFLQKPTPFCFLDEVDAPLDDANVERYTGMVKALSDKTQFILITHNHNTMAIADSVYGVTMQEQGVSSILSVHLEDSAKAGR